jgi:hypothetical protein
MVTPLRVAPLDDAELLRAVATALRQVVLPELERAGAEEFVLSQVRSCLSIVRFVSSGLGERQRAQVELEDQVGELLADHGIDIAELTSPVDLYHRTAAEVPELPQLLRRRLEAEVSSRTRGADT